MCVCVCGGVDCKYLPYLKEFIHLSSCVVVRWERKGSSAEDLTLAAALSMYAVAPTLGLP